MKRTTIAGGVIALILVLLVLAPGPRDRDRHVEPEEATEPVFTPSTAPAASEPHQGFNYGRLTTDEQDVDTRNFDLFVGDPSIDKSNDDDAAVGADAEVGHKQSVSFVKLFKFAHRVAPTTL